MKGLKIILLTIILLTIIITLLTLQENKQTLTSKAINIYGENQSIYAVSPASIRTESEGIKITYSSIAKINKRNETTEYKDAFIIHNSEDSFVLFTPFVIVEGKKYLLRELSKQIDVSYSISYKSFFNAKWSYSILNIPTDISSRMDYAGLDIDSNVYAIAEGNKLKIKSMEIDFSDITQSFPISVSKSQILIGNVRGKTNLVFDPNINLSYVAPTDNASVIITDRNYTYINLSVTNASVVDTFKVEWNGTNITAWGNGLIGHWHLNNNTLDSSGTGKDGTAQNSVNCSANVAGKFGTACKFNGLDTGGDYISVPDFAPPVDLTFEAWVYPLGMSGIRDFIILNKHNSEYDFRLGNIANNQVYFSGSAGGTSVSYYNINFSDTVNQNKWWYVAFTFNDTGNINRLYVNGVEVNSTTNVASIPDQATQLWIGRHSQFNFGSFNGSIDEVRIWNRVLSAKEINITWRSELGKYYANITDNANGTYTYNAWINNTVNDINNSGSRTITFGNSIPTITIENPTNTSYTTANRTLNFTAGDDIGVSQCWYSLNSGTNTSIVGCANTTFDTGANGSFRLRVYVNDTTNQSANANVNFSVNVAVNSCTPTANQQWDLIIGDNCSISGLNITIANWIINYTNGLSNISFSNITYSNITKNAFSGSGRFRELAEIRYVTRRD